jgi:signal recognition particle subunit SRP54
MSSMGSMANLARMIPGVAGKLSDAHLSEAETRLKVFKSLIQSMTPQERAKPELVAASSSRTSRISKGSGRKPSDVASLLSTYGGMRDQMAGLARMLQLKSGADGSPPSMEAINEAARAAQAAGGMPPGGRKSKEAAWREAQQAAKKAEQPAAKAAAPKAKGFGKR